MSDGTKMDLTFDDLSPPSVLRAPKAEVIRVATEAAKAEGFTARWPTPSKTPSRTTVTIQLNVKVPVEIRERFLAAAAAEMEKDRAIRSGGEFFVKMFEAWEMFEEKK